MISGCGLEVGSGGIGPSRKRRSLARMSQLGHEDQFRRQGWAAVVGFESGPLLAIDRGPCVFGSSSERLEQWATALVTRKRRPKLRLPTLRR
jgi:hypothetical protein